MKLKNGLKINVTQIIAYLIIIGITVASSWFLFSCSDAKRSQNGFKKFIKYGGKIEQTSDTIRITTVDSFPTIVHDSIVWVKYFTTKDTIIRYKTVYVPKTRFQTRIEYKTIYKTLKAETKQQKQIQKTERKDSFPWRLLLIVIGLLTLILLTFKWLPK